MSADRAASPELLELLHRDGLLPEEAHRRALALSCASPGVQRWRGFLDWVLLGLGATLVLVGVIFLVAFNWAALPAFAKMGLVASLISGAALVAWRVRLSTLPGRVALTVAAVLVGPLLAIYGQTYQTGADPWSLFAAWAGLVALWVVIGRFPALWLIELALVNVTVALLWDQVVASGRSWHAEEERALLLVLAVLDAAAWLAWELGAWRKVEWMQARWLPRVVAVVCLAFSYATCVSMFDRSHDAEPTELMGAVLLLALVAAALAWFHTGRRDLFMVAAALGAAMTLVTSWAGIVLFDSRAELGGVFALGVLVITEVGAAAWWLRSRHRLWGQQ